MKNNGSKIMRDISRKPKQPNSQKIVRNARNVSLGGETY
jgi:hypothetical protein